MEVGSIITIVLSVAVVIACIVVLALGVNKGLQQPKKTKYDERQVIARGKCFKIGYFTLVVYIFLYTGVEIFFGKWCDILFGAFLGICISLFVVSLLAVKSGAYVRVNQNRANIVFSLICLGTVDFVLGIVLGVLDGEKVIKDGLVQFDLIVPIIGLMALAIGLAVHFQSKKENSDETVEENEEP